MPALWARHHGRAEGMGFFMERTRTSGAQGTQAAQAAKGAAAGGRRRYYSRYIAHYTKKNTGLLALGVLFLAGVLLGTLLLRTAGGETLRLLMEMVGAFVENRRDQSLFQNFVSGATSSLVFLAVLFVSGFCAVSQPLVVAAPLFRGLGVGFSMASLYAAHGVQAAGYIAVMMLPDTVLSMLAILLCCRESLRLSASFFAAMGGGERRDRTIYPLRIYLARYLACGALCVFSAFLGAALNFAFANFFLIR